MTTEMHYNYFTIGYIEAILRRLHLELDSNDRGVFFPERVSYSDLLALRDDISHLWDERHSAIDLLEKKHDSTSQSCLFGMVEDIESALKIGYLLSDRVVLVDYLFERTLCKLRPGNVNIIHIGSICSSLVSALPLARAGRLIIIQNPFVWNQTSKEIISEFAEKTEISLDMVEFLNVLSISVSCNLFPYTISESSSQYKSLVDGVLTVGDDTSGNRLSLSFFQQLFASLQSEKLLENEEFSYLDDMPLSKYQAIIENEEGFYLDFVDSITKGGLPYADLSIAEARKRIKKGIADRANHFTSDQIRIASSIASVGGSVGVILGTVFALPLAFTLSASALNLSGTLGKSLKPSNGTTPLISVFCRLREES